MSRGSLASAFVSVQKFSRWRGRRQQQAEGKQTAATAKRQLKRARKINHHRNCHRNHHCSLARLGTRASSRGQIGLTWIKCLLDGMMPWAEEKGMACCLQPKRRWRGARIVGAVLQWGASRDQLEGRCLHLERTRGPKEGRTPCVGGVTRHGVM